jgi:hypothetical protein
VKVKMKGNKHFMSIFPKEAETVIRISQIRKLRFREII